MLRNKWGVGGLAVVCALMVAGPWVVRLASAKGFVLPHVLEKSGTINLGGPDTSQTQLHFTNTATLGSDSAHFTVSLYDSNTDALITELSQELLAARKETIDLKTMLGSAGAFQGVTQRDMYAIIDVADSGSGASVRMQGFVTNSHTSTAGLEFNYSGFGMTPLPGSGGGGGGGALKTFVLPHVLEKSGRVNNTAYTFDTDMFMTYGGVSSATADVFLLGDNGQAMRAAGGNDVCNPCSFNLGGANHRKASISVDDLILAKGGFDAGVKLGFGIIVVGGADPENVAIQGFVVNSHSTPDDRSTAILAGVAIPKFIDLTNEAKNNVRTHVIPHILETSGTITNTQFTFDTQVFANYTGGIDGTPAESASVDFFLFNQDGSKVVSATGNDVCNPCTVSLSSAARKQTINLDSEIMSKGGFATSATTSMFAVAYVHGDNDSVDLQGFVVNAHTSPFDLSISTSQGVVSPRDRPSGQSTGQRSFVLPHVLETSGKITDAGATNKTDTQLTIIHNGYLLDSNDQPIAGGGGAGSVDGDIQATVHLFNADGTEILPAGGAFTFTLDADSPVWSLTMEDIVLAAGGFGPGIDPAYATVDLTGNTDYASLQGFVVNSHTGPFDVSVFGFEPQEITAAAAVPEPSSIALAVAGLLCLAFRARRKRHAV